MDISLFINDLNQVLDGALTNGDLDQPLEKLDCWDSLAIIMTIGLVDKHFSVSLSGQEIEKCKRVREIIELIRNLKGA